MTPAITRYALVIVVTIAFVAWLLTLALSGAGASSAIAISAMVAAVVQIAAFAVTKSMAPKNVIAAWGAGSLVRLVTLFVYALLAVKVLALPPVPALISLAVFFFLSTLLEPVFLRR
jgi:hypothetical protein